MGKDTMFIKEGIECENGIMETLRLSRVREKWCASMASAESLVQISQLIIAKPWAVQHPCLNWSWLWADHGWFIFKEDCVFFTNFKFVGLRWRLFPLNHFFQHVSNKPTSSKTIWHWTWTSILFKRNISFQSLCSGVSHSIIVRFCVDSSVFAWLVDHYPHVRLLAATVASAHRCIWSITACLWSFSLRLAMFPNTVTLTALPGRWGDFSATRPRAISSNGQLQPLLMAMLMPGTEKLMAAEVEGFGIDCSFGGSRDLIWYIYIYMKLS